MSIRALLGPVWRWPTLLGVATAFGLVSALLGDGVWDAVSWLALGAPVLVGLVLSNRKYN